VLNYAFHADKLATSNTEVSHQLFWVLRTKIGFLHQLLLFVCKFKCQVIFGQLFSFEWLLQPSPADGTECQALLLNFDQTNLTKGVTAVEIAGYKCFSIKILIARGAFHFNF